MKVLIIDDEAYKRKVIKDYLNDLGVSDINEKTFRNEGLYELINSNNSYNLLVLDMNFPAYKDSYPEKNMGLNVLREIKTRKRLNDAVEKLKIIICSSEPHDDYDEYEKVIGIIKYNSSVYLKPQFEELLKKIK